MNTPHKHAELIKAWADGAEIEYFSKADNCWKLILQPAWRLDGEYRVKPVPHKWQKEMDAHAQGKPIQFRLKSSPNVKHHEWVDCPNPFWKTTGDAEYRIKPKCVVKFGCVGEAVACGLTTEQGCMDNLKLTFENSKLVKAEVLK